MRRFFHKRLYLISACLVLVLLVGTINAFVRNNKPVSTLKSGLKFGATYMTMNNPFYEIIDAEIRSELEAKGDTLVSRDPALDVQKQIEQIEDFIQMHVRAIFLTPVDVGQLHRVLLEARQAGIPVIAVDSQVSDRALVVSTITSDNYGAGVLCAQNLLKTRSGGNILILEQKSAQSATDRIRGFEDTLKGHNTFRVVGRGDCLGQLERAMPIVETLLRQAPQPDVVMALNDPSALGAMAALRDHGLLSKVLVYGVDGSPEAKAMIAEGNMTATAAQFPTKIGKEAVQQMYRIINRQPYDQIVTVPVELVTQENVVDFGTNSWQ
ncbi:MAG: sugar ABC transporter substrate-binding protein [Ethanoligenens sp.]|uniref:sugar ABC transporter substrate-binding protein n=1 Tax=Ethanoligenens sp. TaxID=2099655 RepID=UPI0039E7CA7B